MPLFFTATVSVRESEGIAHYTNSINNKTDYKGKYDIWQYTSKGNIAGINGNVDLNIIFQ